MILTKIPYFFLRIIKIHCIHASCIEPASSRDACNNRVWSLTDLLPDIYLFDLADLFSWHALLLFNSLVSRKIFASSSLPRLEKFFESSCLIQISLKIFCTQWLNSSKYFIPWNRSRHEDERHFVIWITLWNNSTTDKQISSTFLINSDKSFQKLAKPLKLSSLIFLVWLHLCKKFRKS